jgi:hypothetical protein
LTPYWILIVFLLSVGLTNSIYAEPKDIEIDWVIEGQIPSVESGINDESRVDLLPEKNSLIDEQIENFISPENKISDEIAEDYITGSKYMLGNKEITIDSKEGQFLNKILIEQRQHNKDNFFHMIKYLDRYSDGYVEVVEALLDPIKKQQYVQGGVNRDFNHNSNLEHFLIERGYSLDDMESIPNHVFSPTKYDAVRAAASSAADSGAESTDLREFLPNYVKPDSKDIHAEMIRNLSEQTTSVYDSISSTPIEISVKQSPDLTNAITNSLFDDFQFVNTKFENTQHVIDTLDTPKILLTIDSQFEYLILILVTISVVVGLIIFGYLLYQKSRVKQPMNLVMVPTIINYLENTNNMIESSRNLFDGNSPKYAFEKFSQAIRYYYSHKLKINLDLTTTQTLIELEKSNIDNFDDVKKWLLLCGQVEFIKHKSTQKEFLKSLDSFSKSIS